MVWEWDNSQFPKQTTAQSPVPGSKQIGHTQPHGPAPMHVYGQDRASIPRLSSATLSKVVHASIVNRVWCT
eukprot:m.748854 g.748854  ORF g.748854 m.748854 type:complete len:71 (-) comp23149_c0_seq3:2979-3191(-)